MAEIFKVVMKHRNVPQAGNNLQTRTVRSGSIPYDATHRQTDRQN